MCWSKAYIELCFIRTNMSMFLSNHTYLIYVQNEQQRAHNGSLWTTLTENVLFSRIDVVHLSGTPLWMIQKNHMIYGFEGSRWIQHTNYRGFTIKYAWQNIVDQDLWDHFTRICFFIGKLSGGLWFVALQVIIQSQQHRFFSMSLAMSGVLLMGLSNYNTSGSEEGSLSTTEIIACFRLPEKTTEFREMFIATRK